MIRKLWVKFDELEVMCTCDKKNEDCEKDGCEQYIVKFTPVDKATRRRLSSSPKKFHNHQRTLTSELTKPIKKK